MKKHVLRMTTVSVDTSSFSSSEDALAELEDRVNALILDMEKRGLSVKAINPFGRVAVLDVDYDQGGRQFASVDSVLTMALTYEEYVEWV